MPKEKILARLAILFAPLLAWQAIELFVLPIDHFTFRFWEALLVQKIHLLPGPFYPNIDLEKYSAGDKVRQAPGTKFVRFHSDEFGQRNPASPGDTYDIVFVGDSNIVGSNVDEPDTIRAVLEKDCHCSVYVYGDGLPNNITGFLEDERFRRNPPAKVIFEFRPGDFEQGRLPVYEACKGSKYANRALVARSCDSLDSPLLHVLDAVGLSGNPAALVYTDRFFKQPAYQYLHSRLGLSITPDVGVTPAIKPDDARLRQSATALRSYRAAVEMHGSTFALFVMPRYTIGARRGLPSPWLTALREENFHVISIDSSTTPADILSAWWMKDDSHWREESIAFSARLLSKGVGDRSEKADRHASSSTR